MLTKKKKIFIILGMVVMLAVTGYLNYKLNNNISEPTTSTYTSEASANFFVTYREDRTETRNQEIEYLNAIIASTASTTEQTTTATNMKFELISKMEQELSLEGLIKAKGFSDAIVSIGSSNINVIIKGESLLEPSEVAQILSVVTSETQASPTNVKIFPVE